ncbi:hypothetical protein WA158_005614 [Blastocystis sp. Blastoise]
MQVTDVHFADADEKDVQNLALLRKLLDYEQPDMVAITGDLVSGYKWNKTQGWYKHYWEMATEPLVKRNIPYAFALGNHDGEADLTRQEVMKLDITNPNSVSQVGPEELPGGSNYLLQIKASNNDSNALNLWFFDSQNKDCGGVKGWGCVAPETVEWYYQKSQQVEKKEGKKLPGLSFLHIPPPEILNAWNFGESFSTKGEKHDLSGCSSVNTGLVSRMIMRGDVSGMFMGHDHRNTYDGNYYGLHLCYGRVSGYGGYKLDDWIDRGIRMIEIDEETGNWTSYIRGVSLRRWELEQLHWTNGTQYYCNGSVGSSLYEGRELDE